MAQMAGGQPGQAGTDHDQDVVGRGRWAGKDDRVEGRRVLLAALDLMTKVRVYLPFALLNSHLLT